MNPHERAARYRKALALIAAIDSVWTKTDEVPTARDVGEFTPVMWANLARIAKVARPPSEVMPESICRCCGERPVAIEAWCAWCVLIGPRKREAGLCTRHLDLGESVPATHGELCDGCHVSAGEAQDEQNAREQY